MPRVRPVSLLACFLVVFTFVHAQSKHLNSNEARNHIGERATVCGKVVSTHYASKTRGEPTFLNLDEEFPKQVFTIVIWGSDRPKFVQPEEKYLDKNVCVTGKVISYRGIPEIAASQPNQIELEK